MFPSLVVDTAGPGGVRVLFEVAIMTFFCLFVFFSMKVYVKAQGIQNSIKLMLLHPGVAINKQ